jgi:hypothetical protein
VPGEAGREDGVMKDWKHYRYNRDSVTGTLIRQRSSDMSDNDLATGEIGGLDCMGEEWDLVPPRKEPKPPRT